MGLTLNMPTIGIFALIITLALAGCGRNAAPEEQVGNPVQIQMEPEADIAPDDGDMLATSETEDTTLIISEFLAANDTGLQDEDGDRSDWVELFNAGSEGVDLSDYALTQDRSLENIWEFPSVIIGPKEYLVVFASGKDRREPAAEEWHTSFKLKSGGEFLALIRKEPRSMVHGFGTSYPKQQQDVSYGIAADWVPGEFLQDYFSHFLQPSPGISNGDILFGFVDDVEIGREAGFVEAPFELTLQTSTPGAVIRYTTDGREPTMDHGHVYEQAIPIDRSTVLRVAAFKAGFKPSDLETRSYLFIEDVMNPSTERMPALPVSYPSLGLRVGEGIEPMTIEHPLHREAMKQGLLDIPSVSIVMDPEALFGTDAGIYHHPEETGRDWERTCSVEYLVRAEDPGFQIDCGIRVRASANTSPDQPKHAFRLFFRDVYGPSKLKYPLFADAKITAFDTLNLRTTVGAGWDPSVAAVTGSFSHALFQRDLQRAMGQLAPHEAPCHLYVNGIYWGLYLLGERPDAAYAAEHLKGGKGDFDVIKIEQGDTPGMSVTDGDGDAWERLWTAVEQGIASNENYFHLQGKQADGMESPESEVLLEVDALIDAMLWELWGREEVNPSLQGDLRTDWYALRNREGEEGFRYIAWNRRPGSTAKKEAMEPPSNMRTPEQLWQSCLSNKEFMMRVADRIHHHFFHDGALASGRPVDHFDRRTGELSKALVGEFVRWGGSGETDTFAAVQERVAAWRRQADTLRDKTVAQRSEGVLQALRAQGFYPATAAPELVVQDGEASLSAPQGEIFYTLDGRDPRQVGGHPADSASSYEDPIAVQGQDGMIKARVRLEGEWSPLVVWTP